MPDLKPGVISDTARKPNHTRAQRKAETEAARWRLTQDTIGAQGRAQGVKEARAGLPCAPLAPDTLKDDLERAAWVDGYMDGHQETVRSQHLCAEVANV